MSIYLVYIYYLHYILYVNYIMKVVYAITIRKEIDLKEPLSSDQAKMLNALTSRPISPDEDCPELTQEQLTQFRRISAENREVQQKWAAMLQLYHKAKRSGKCRSFILYNINTLHNLNKLCSVYFTARTMGTQPNAPYRPNPHGNNKSLYQRPEIECATGRKIQSFQYPLL